MGRVLSYKDKYFPGVRIRRAERESRVNIVASVEGGRQRPRTTARRPWAMRTKWCSACILVAALGGCVQYQAAPLEPQRSADEFAARRLAEVRLRDEYLRLMPETTMWPPREWDRAELLAVAFILGALALISTFIF